MSDIIKKFNESALQLMQGNIVGGMVILFIWTFTESSFFPLPPDFVMWGLVHLNPELWVVYATVTTVASVTGALFGHFLGEKAGKPILKKFISGTDQERDEKITKVENLFKDYENMAILIAALTPIPYKIFTIVAGIIGMPKKGFIIWSIIGRGLRFYTGAYLFSVISTNKKLGEYISKNIEFIFVGIALIFLVGFIINLYMKKRKK